jgi:Zn-dependent protease with chaperone function
MAKMMKKIDMRSQLEASMISMTFIMIGMIIMVIYLIIYAQMGLFYKGLIVFNLLCAFIFISSFLITTYHQYISFMEISGIDPDKHKEEIKKRGNIFKRIKLALKKKQNIELNPAPQLVKDAVENMIKIKQDELKDYQKLEVQADKLRREEDNKQK